MRVNGTDGVGEEGVEEKSLNFTLQNLGNYEIVSMPRKLRYMHK